MTNFSYSKHNESAYNIYKETFCSFIFEDLYICLYTWNKKTYTIYNDHTYKDTAYKLK